MTSQTIIQLSLSEIFTIIGAIVLGFISIIGFLNKQHKRISDVEETSKQVALNTTKIEAHEKQLTEGKAKFNRLDEIVLERDKQLAENNNRCQKHWEKTANIELEHVRMLESNRNTDVKLNQMFEMINDINKTLQALSVSFAEFKRGTK